MVQELIRLVSGLYTIVLRLIIVALLAAATLAMWHFYRQELFQAQLREAGEPITVRIDHTDRKTRDVWDAFSPVVYVGFTYHNHPYETRCVSDSAWISAGDPINLRYLPQEDTFGQPRRTVASSPTRIVSRLIDWTVIREVKPENRLLGGFILTALALFFCAGGLIVGITGWTFIQTVARLLFVTGIGISALFSTYDAIRYYQYADTLRTKGRAMDVVVADTDRHTHGRGTTHWYTYDATFRYKRQERVIPVDEPDYDRIKSGNTRLAVRYETIADDFIAEAYAVGFSQLILPLFFWFLFIVAIRPTAVPPAVVR